MEKRSWTEWIRTILRIALAWFNIGSNEPVTPEQSIADSQASENDANNASDNIEEENHAVETSDGGIHFDIDGMRECKSESAS